MPALKFDKASTTWVFGDPHAFHKNICKGCTTWKRGADRNFNNPEEMTAYVASTINQRILPDHDAICLGDWSFAGFDNIKRFRDMIACKNIYLILGNHDHHIANNKGDCRKLFKEVYGWHGVYCQVEIKVGNHDYFCGHFKPAVWNHSNKNVRALWAHSHGTYPDSPNELSFDTGWDCFQRPLNFVEVEKIMSTKKWIPVDHHDEETNG